MTYMETAEMNRPYKESEVALLSVPTMDSDHPTSADRRTVGTLGV